MDVDFDSLTVTQQLLLETVAARHRLGHESWHIERKAKKTLEALHDKGLVNYWGCGTGFQAQLTHMGEKLLFVEGYVPPILQQKAYNTLTAHA